MLDISQKINIISISYQVRMPHEHIVHIADRSHRTIYESIVCIDIAPLLIFL